MPTYDYRCQACGHEFEEFQAMSANPLRKCPQCGKLKLKRLIGTGAGIIFKGSGFYETDYRSEGYKRQAKAEQDQAAGKSDKGDKGDQSAQGQGDKADAPGKGDTKTQPKSNADRATQKPAEPPAAKPNQPKPDKSS